LFQKNVNKQYELRIAVVGSDVEAIKIDSQSVDEGHQDWRRVMDRNDIYSRCEIPDELRDRLVRFHEALNLPWSMVDMIVDSEQRYIFLESNPDGAWLWLEKAISDSPITRLIAKRLSSQR
jgi:glutathione synthase/RimK-type ligase-like ATP-grasp enzyme